MDNLTRPPVGEGLELLQQAYPAARCSLEVTSPMEALVAVLLSAQCRDERVNQVTRQLFSAFRSAADYAGAELTDLETALKTLGLFRNKAKNLRALGQQLMKDYQGAVPATVAELMTLPGVGRKTAVVVRQEAFGGAEGIAVDTHVGRLARRLGWTEATDPGKIELDLQAIVPGSAWAVINHLLIAHGRAVCTARRPGCAVCMLRDYCRTGRTGTEEG